MSRSRTAFLAGLWLFPACLHAAPPRGQYRVTFKIVNGRFAVARDSFQVTPPFVKFEPEIRRNLAQALTLQASSTFVSLVANLLLQTPDFGLILNDEQVDPAGNSISFSVLPLFDSARVRLDFPEMKTTSTTCARARQLRKRLAKLNGQMWSTAQIRAAIAPLYANLGLSPQILVLPRDQTIQIIEGPRIASIVFAAVQVPAADINALLWNLLDTRRYHLALRSKPHWLQNRILDYDRDLGYAAGDEPYAIQSQLQALQLLISPLGYTLNTQMSARSGAGQYVNLVVQKAPRAKSGEKSRHIAGGFQYNPGQGVGALATLQWDSLNLSAGGPSGILGSGSYSFSRLRFSVNASAGVSEELNRYLNGVRVNQQSTTESAAFGWQLWRGLDGDSLRLQLNASHALAFSQNLNTIRPGAVFLHNDLTSEYPSRSYIDPSIRIGPGFANCLLTANTHRKFDYWEYDVGAHFENSLGDAPIFELPSFGGAATVRGFRADDAIGRRLWAVQSELWQPLPHLAPLKMATFLDVGGAYQTIGSTPGLRVGPGVGLRLDLRVAVLKFDWAYGFGVAATEGSRGKFYFNVVLNTPQ